METKFSCPCGHVHVVPPALAWIIRTIGPEIAVHIRGLGTWRVPRAYIGIHGVTGREIAKFAKLYNWPEISKSSGSEGQGSSHLPGSHQRSAGTGQAPPGGERVTIPATPGGTEPVGMRCPGCGQLAAFVITPPGKQAFCQTDGCRILMWDPTLSLEQNMTNLKEVDLTRGDS